MLLIIEEHRQRVRNFWNFYGSGIQLPDADSWQRNTDDDVWLRVVSQVVVVGGVNPIARFDDGLRRRLSWTVLAELTEAEVTPEIWAVLKKIGTRYVGKVEGKCRKSQALYRNFQFLKEVGGPRAFIESVAAIDRPESRISFVQNNLSYIKNKGARDFLTSGFGLLSDSIALDTRVLNALTAIGVEGLPASTPGDRKIYREMEREIVDNLCMPVGITAAQLDQLLFKHYDAIRLTNFG